MYPTAWKYIIQIKINLNLKSIQINQEAVSLMRQRKFVDAVAVGNERPMLTFWPMPMPMPMLSILADADVS